MPQHYDYIATQADWDAAAAELRAVPRLALDTERNGRFAYRERICLIQIADDRHTWLLDPLSVPDLSALGDLLADPAILKTLHGCEEDIRYLHGDFGFAVRNLFDTGMAARFAGVTRPNLGAVLEEFCGVSIPKDPRLQVSNWGQRPLSARALDYAAGDVHHLLPLTDALRRRLHALGRAEWVQEECRRIAELRHPPEEPLETAYRRVKGWDTLTPRQAAVLQEIYAFRDGKACVWNLPPAQTASNADLLLIAQSDGGVVRGVGGLLANRCYGELLDAVARGMGNPEPPPLDGAEDAGREIWTPERRERLKTLKQWRAGLGSELGLAVSHIWPTRSLERIARQPDTLREELGGDTAGNTDSAVREWQRAEFGDALGELVATAGWP